MNKKEVGISITSAIIRVVLLIIFLFLLIKYSKVAYSYGRGIFNQTPVSTGEGEYFNVTILEGETVSELADALEGAGLIKDAFLFRIQEYFSEYHGLEQPGVYTLSTAMTPDEMLAIICANADKGDSESGSGEVESNISDNVNVEDNSSGTGAAEGEDMGSEGEDTPLEGAEGGEGEDAQ